MRNIFKFIVILSTTALIAGCKLAVIVVEGGEVQSEGSGTCLAGDICIIEVPDFNFQETFTAVPNSGWYLEKWQVGNRFFCGGSNRPTCILSLFSAVNGEATEEQIELLEPLVDSSETFYLMPVFREGVNSVEVDGRKWLQPVEFLGYSYDQIAAVCPLPSGECSGSLAANDIDLTGYTWASENDIATLFQAFAAAPPYYESEENTTPFLGSRVENSDFFQYFLPENDTHGGFLTGWLRDPSNVIAEVWENYEDSYFLLFPATDPVELTLVGAWFWRPVE